MGVEGCRVEEASGDQRVENWLLAGESFKGKLGVGTEPDRTRVHPQRQQQGEAGAKAH